jgi:hypothetical protein
MVVQSVPASSDDAVALLAALLSASVGAVSNAYSVTVMVSITLFSVNAILNPFIN